MVKYISTQDQHFKNMFDALTPQIEEKIRAFKKLKWKVHCSVAKEVMPTSTTTVRNTYRLFEKSSVEKCTCVWFKNCFTLIARCIFIHDIIVYENFVTIFSKIFFTCLSDHQIKTLLLVFTVIIHNCGHTVINSNWQQNYKQKQIESETKKILKYTMQLLSVCCHLYYDRCSSFKYISEYIGSKVVAHPPDKSNSLDTKISFDLTELNLYKLNPFNKTIQFKIFKENSFHFLF